MARWWLLLGGVLFAAGLGWWALQVALLGPAERGTAAGYGQFVLAAIGLLIMIVGPIHKAFIAPAAPDLDQLTDLLAVAMRNQWTKAATDRRLLQPAPLPIRWCRTTEPVAGPTTAATLPRGEHALLDPLPGLSRVTSNRLRRGTRRDLHRVYGGLASGRLLIIGGPGSGKSSAALLLLLDALRYRDQATPADRPHIPVPVLFTLQNWDSADTSVEDWLRTKFTEISLFRGRRGGRDAIALLRAGRIAVFLDGLDEIPPQSQPLALQALSEQTTYRLVLLTRTADLVTAAQQHALVGAVALELRPLQAADVADYLLRPLTEPAPPAWRDLATALTDAPGSVVEQALTNPLTVSLLRDIYQPTDPVDELLDFTDPEVITNHLLDQAVTAAYTARPGQPSPRYTVRTAHNTLAVIAHHLNRRGTRDLAWWHIPQWIPHTPRALVTGALTAAACFLTVGLVLTAAANLVVGLVFATAIALLAGLHNGGTIPPILTSFRLRQALTVRTLGAGLAAGLVAGLWRGSTLGLTTGLLVAVLVGAANAMTTKIESTEPTGPANIWRNVLASRVLLAPAVGVMSFIVVTLAYGHLPGVMASLIGATAWLTLLLLSEVWRTAAAQFVLTVRHGTPLRLMRFLEDARSRHLLRTVGPVYQFKHATLQDRLAAYHPNKL